MARSVRNSASAVPQNDSHNYRRQQGAPRLLAEVAILAALVVLGINCGRPATTAGSLSDGEILRVRGIAIVDEDGRERIVLGAPLPDPAGGGPRVSTSTGIAINDEDGFERFAVGLLENGLLNMGFDGAPGTGDDTNRERINIGVTADGRGYMRFLDRRTALAGILYLSDDDDLVFEIWHAGTDSTIRKRLSIEGWEQVDGSGS